MDLAHGKTEMIDEQKAVAFLQRQIEVYFNKSNGDLRDCLYSRALSDAVGLGMQVYMNMLHSCNANAEKLWRELKQQKSFSANRYCSLLGSWLASSENLQKNSHQSLPGPLSSSDLEHWQENGYVIVKNIIARETALDIANSLAQRKGFALDDSESWQNLPKGPIWQRQFDLPELEIARQSKIALNAFQQIWQCQDLVITRDQYSINFPESHKHCFQGPKLHLDVDFNFPMHFKTQGIVYLNDVAADQGAFTVCPGFHLNYQNWINSLPSGTDPNEVDFYQFPHKSIAAEAGDLIIWHHWLPHGASPNHHQSPRVAQYLDMYSLTPRYVAPGNAF